MIEHQVLEDQILGIRFLMFWASGFLLLQSLWIRQKIEAGLPLAIKKTSARNEELTRGTLNTREGYGTICAVASQL